MKLHIMTDLEGVAGVFSFARQSYLDTRYFDDAKRLLTAEVNAAVDGAVSAGATDVLVDDGHGPGGIHFESLHPAARVLHGSPRWPVHKWGEIYKEYTYSSIVGQHAMEGTADSTLNHTQSSQLVDYYKLNGRPIGEIAQWALCMGAFGIPVIFLAGDEAACREVEALIPGVTAVAVKKGLTRGCAISLSPQRAHQVIREGIVRAINRQSQSPVQPLTWPGPYRLEIRFRNTDTADEREARGWERVDSKTVAFNSSDILDAIWV